MNEQLLIGMSPGASRDRVEAVLINVNHDAMDILHATRTPFPVAIRQTLNQLIAAGRPSDGNLASLLDDNLGRFFARVAQDLARDAGIEMRDISAIGSHGQNVWGHPDSDHPRAVQLGNGPLMAKNTGATVINNFRAADLEAGGRGAPFTPLLHRHLFQSDVESRAVLNIGVTANLTLLPGDGEVFGFDCGPGNCLMDAWTRRHLHQDYDRDGNWARKGEADITLLNQLLKESQFSLSPPESTGAECFNIQWLDNVLLDTNSQAEPLDVQATLAELTVASVVAGLEGRMKPDRLLVCGGGAHNRFLMRRLAAHLPDTVVETTARHGAAPDWIEGILFAWLAKQRLAGVHLDTRQVTGAGQLVLLGDIHRPPERG